MSTIAMIAPDWIATLNSSERSPSHCSAMSRCPVLEIGRNSVMPSMMPRITVLRVSDTRLGLVRPPGCGAPSRSEEHTSELQSRGHLVCRLLLEKKKKKDNKSYISYLFN